MASVVPVLACRNITKRFGSEVLAVNDVSFSLGKGDLLGLLGPSGCGKTTLLRLVAGFERPEAGEVELAGQMICGDGAWVPPERRRVGVVFQDYALFPHLTVAENVTFGLKQLCRRGELAKKQINDLAGEAISLVGLSEMVRRYPHELSGGQQQRVALARALAPRPPLILLDEPFSNLDVQVRLYLRQEVRDILKNIGASGIFVTHDQEEALAIADKVAVMNEGRLVQLDEPEEIYQNPASRFIAEFVTQANFIKAVKSGDRWETVLGRARGIPGEGDLMVAQEDLKVSADERGDCVVQGRQFLGRVYQYSLLMPSGQVLLVRTSASQRLAVGDRASVRLASERVRFFPTRGKPIILGRRTYESGVEDGSEASVG